MPEPEKNEQTPSVTPGEDVDDLIFQSEPPWLVSQR